MVYRYECPSQLTTIINAQTTIILQMFCNKQISNNNLTKNRICMYVIFLTCPTSMTTSLLTINTAFTGASRMFVSQKPRACYLVWLSKTDSALKIQLTFHAAHTEVWQILPDFLILIYSGHRTISPCLMFESPSLVWLLYCYRINILLKFGSTWQNLADQNSNSVCLKHPIR